MSVREEDVNPSSEGEGSHGTSHDEDNVRRDELASNSESGQGSGLLDNLIGTDWSLVNPSDLPQKVIEVQESVHKTLVRQWRAAITGDPEKRIRDNMTDAKVRTRVKQVDALSFTIGVAFSYVAQFVFLMRPDLFPYLYMLSMAILLPHRFFTYRSTNDHWFMMDFCYWVNSSLILHQLLCPCSPDGGFCAYWFKLLYVLVSGPISAAVILWGNSLVFHSIDKVTSFAIHILPAMLVYLVRWSPAYVSSEATDICYANPSLTFWSGWAVPVLCWMTWQAIYLYVQFSHLDFHPELVTSQRYIMENAKKSFLVTIWGKLTGLFVEDESGQYPGIDEVRSTATFVSMSLVIMMVTMFQGLLFYYSQALNTTFILAMILSAIWKGATFYIHIFSSRYNKKFPNAVQRKSSVAFFNKDE